jgi:hypothetical protein
MTLLNHTSRKLLRRREERFLSRQELAERWSLSIREIISREKRGILRPYRFSYKGTRYRLSDVLIVEEKAAKAKLN